MRLMAVAIVAMGAMALAMVPEARASESRLSRLAWLAGCWEARSPSRSIEENWTSARGGTMMGVSRTVRGDRLAEYELVLIKESGDTLIYEAHPSGQRTATFAAREITDSLIVFSNPAHDYPQVVGYRRAGTDSPWIDGRIGGKARRVEFPYSRVRCLGPR